MEQQAANASPSPERIVTVAGLIHPLARRRLRILLLLCCGIAAGILYFFLKSPVYEAKMSILPPANPSGGLLRGLGEISDFAGLAFDLGGDGSELYPEVVRSDRLLGTLLDAPADAFGGRTLYELLDLSDLPEDRESALESLRSRVGSRRSVKTGLLQIAVQMPDPAVARSAARLLLDGLDEFYRVSSMTRASQLREFLSERLEDVQHELRTAEEDLTAFRAANRSVQNSPGLLQEEGRLQREVRIQEAVFIELTRQNELAKVGERKNLPVIRVLDEPGLPAKPSSPRLGSSVASFVLLALLLALCSIYAQEYLLPGLRQLATQA